jgi:hypothetical protein
MLSAIERQRRIGQFLLLKGKVLPVNTANQAVPCENQMDFSFGVFLLSVIIHRALE